MMENRDRQEEKIESPGPESSPNVGKWPASNEMTGKQGERRLRVIFFNQKKIQNKQYFYLSIEE